MGTVFLCRPDISRAQWAVVEEADTTTQRIQLMNSVIWVASRIWIIPAKLAGLLMTNYFVYGTSFYLVDYLFMFWQIIRTFALYGLWLYFVGYILYSWFHPDEAKSKIADLFKNTLIAGVLISMSWWLVAAAVDLSLVFTSAVASIPSQIYEQEWSKKQQCFSAPIRATLSPGWTPDADLAGNPTNHRAPDRKILKPEGDDISWPLMFFGASVLKFFDMVYIPEQQLQWSWSSDATIQRDLSKTLIIVFVKALLALWLVIPLVILMVVNMIRVVCLWLWIIFSPGIVLINIFGMKVSDQLDKYLSWQNILWLIMQPVAVVGMLSIGLIFIIELASVFNLCVQQPNNSPLAVRTVSEGIDAPIGELLNPIWAETTLWASMSAIGDTIGGITGELIMAIFVIILVRSLIKIGFSFSELTKETASSIYDSVETMAASVPLVPLPGIWRVGLWAAQKFAKWSFWLDKQLGKRIANQEDAFMENMWFKNNWQIKSAKLFDLGTKAKATDTPLNNLQTAVAEQIKSSYIQANNAKSITKEWLKSSWSSLENIKKIKSLWLTTLANWLSNNSLTPEELEKIRNKDSAYYADAHKLLNWLFWKPGPTVATNSNANVTQYGNWGE